MLLSSASVAPSRKRTAEGSADESGSNPATASVFPSGDTAISVSTNLSGLEERATAHVPAVMAVTVRDAPLANSDRDYDDAVMILESVNPLATVPATLGGVKSLYRK